MITFAQNQLAAQLNNLLDPENHDSPETLLATCAINMLLAPDDQYLVLDSEGDDQAPGWLLALNYTGTASWSGQEHPAMLGYGQLGYSVTAYGTVLQMSLGGSGMSSASTIWVVPAGLFGFMANPDD